MNGYLDTRRDRATASPTTSPCRRSAPARASWAGSHLRGRTRGSVSRVRLVSGGLVLLAVLAVPAAGGTRGVSVPAGFRVETFARGLAHPTAMAYGPDGRIYVTQDGGTLVAIRRGTRSPQVLVRGLRTPLGLALEREQALRLGAGPARAVRTARTPARGPARARSRPAVRPPPAGQRGRRLQRAPLLGQRVDLRRVP